MIEGAASPLSVVALLAGLHVAIVLTPGNNTALLIYAAAKSRRSGFLTAFGFMPANVVFAVAGMAGAGSLFRALPWLEPAMKTACGLYLVWIGFDMLRHSFRARLPNMARPAPSTRDTLRTALVTSFTNPKSIAYFMSIFAATGATELPFGWKIVAVGMMPVIGFSWHATLISIVSSKPVMRVFDSLASWFDRLAGAVLLMLGLNLVISR